MIAKPFMKATGGSGHALHASGREDIDALCLDWRPFVFEVKEPKHRNVDLGKMRRAINRTKKVNVSPLSYCDRKELVRVKSARPDKSYLAEVAFSKPVKDPEALKRLIGTVQQRTPTRVAHRRADLLRKREVKDIKWRRVNNKKYELQIRGEAGLYVKELVTGDGGRTDPSVSALLKNPAKVINLSVIRIWD